MLFGSGRSALCPRCLRFTHTRKNKHTHANQRLRSTSSWCVPALTGWPTGCSVRSVITAVGQGAVFLTRQMVQRHAASGNRDNRLPPRR